MGRFVQILKIKQSNLSENELNIDSLTEENYIKMDTNTFLIKALESYRGLKFNENAIITDIIECNLSDVEDEAKKQWIDGITTEVGKYIGWFASVGNMKKQDKNNGKCNTFFIKEDMKGFTEWIEKNISLGKFAEMEKLDEININKDMLSRLSLITSIAITETELDIDNLVILKGNTLNIAGNKYKTVRPITYIEQVVDKKTKEVSDVERIKYELETWTAPEKKEIDIFDGGGVMGLNVANRIGKALNRNDIEFAVIREYTLGVKGLVTRFNIERYLNTFYKEDTETFKKESGKFYALDMFNNWREINNNTLLLNESMVKLAKQFKEKDEFTGEDKEVYGMNEIKSLMDTQAEQFKDEEGQIRNNIFDKLYITKVNKREEKIEQYTRLNYQLLNALNITGEELIELAKEDITFYKKLIKPYEKIEVTKDGEDKKIEFKVNADMINLFYNKCSSEKSDFKEVINNVVDKTNLLINIDDNLIKTSFVKNQLCKLIEKKVRELALGKITCKALYQYCAIDPLHYINTMMGIETKITLEKDGFYSANCNNKSIRTIQRNPLMAYSEVLNVEFVRNLFLDNWLSQCKELIYFNQKSDVAVTLSTADFDGDGILVIDNSIIRNSVVTPSDGLRFYNKEDGDKAPLKLTPENRFIATYKASGNLIGEIAVKGAIINTTVNQKVEKYYETTTNTWYSYTQLGLKYKELEGHLKDNIKEKIKLGELQHLNNVDRLIVKDKISSQFKENETDVYTALLLSQKAIDAPKTLIFPDKDDLYALEDYSRKPWFLQYDKDYYTIKNLGEKLFSKQYMYYTNSTTMDRFAMYISDIIIEPLNKCLYDKVKFSDRAELLQRNLKMNVEVNVECLNIITALYGSYNKAIDEKSNVFRKTKLKVNAIENEYERNKQLKSLLKQYKLEKKLMLNKAIESVEKHIYSKYDLHTVCNAIANMEKCSERFILDIFVDTLTVMNTNVNKPKAIFKESEEGNLIFRGKKYLKITENCDIREAVNNIKIDDMIQNGTAKLVRFSVLDESIKEDLTVGLILNLNDERICKFEKSEKDKKQYEGLKEEITILKIEKISARSFGIVVGL